MPLKLFVPNDGQSEADVPLRWCVTPGVLEVLKSEGAAEPFLLVTVYHETKKEVFRGLYRLEEAMAYVQLNQAGHHIFRATIVWTKMSSRALFKQLMSLLRANHYSNMLYDKDGEFMESWLKAHLSDIKGSNIEEAVINVNVGTEFFAKEPPKWVRKWVDYWYSIPSRDQCQLRRRGIAAFTIQPFVMLLYISLTTVFRLLWLAFGLAWGLRNIDPSPVLHPFRESIGDIFPDIDNSRDLNVGAYNFFITRKVGPERYDVKQRSKWFLLLHPLIYLALCAIVLVTHHYGGWKLTLHAAKILGVAVAIVAAAAVVIKLFIILVELTFDAAIARKAAARKARALQQKPQEFQKFDTDLLDIVCDGNPELALKVSALPKRRQTVSLRFRATKAKVCRPFRT